MVEVDPRVRKLSRRCGGPKQNLLNQIQGDVREYYKVHGEKETRERFDIANNNTWDRVINGITYKTDKYTKTDHALAEATLAKQIAYGAERRVQRMEERVNEIEENMSIKIAQKYLLPWLKTITGNDIPKSGNNEGNVNRMTIMSGERSIKTPGI